MTDQELYNKIWEVVGQHVGYGIECDQTTDEIWDIIMEDDADQGNQRSYDQTAGFMMGAMFPFK